MTQNYFDNASTTKTDKRVIEAMLPYFTEIFGNASSNHEFGKNAKMAIELSRNHVSELIVIKTKHIYSNTEIYKFHICHIEYQ